MKNIVLKTTLFLLLIACCQTAFGQLAISKKSKNKTWIIANNTPTNLIRVEIQELKDSVISVLLIDRAMPSTLKDYNVNEVKRIKFRSKKKVRRNLIIGTSIGAFMGSIYWGLFKSPLPERYLTDKYLGVKSGLVGGVIGGAIGYGIGSIKITIPIKGQQMKYEKKRKKIKKHAF